MASVRSLDDAMNIQVPKNGVLLRNLIHGADTVMSHILHFYHLAAVDFVDATVLGSPWSPAFGTRCTCALVSALANNPFVNATGEFAAVTNILLSYVTALDIRREAHTMGAIFSGRQPIQNAIVPGGVSTIFTKSDSDNFKTHLNKIRNFINQVYIPDVVFVATRSQMSVYADGATTGSNGNVDDWTKYWGVGTNPGHLLSYGEYPLGTYTRYLSTTNLLIPRGTVDYSALTAVNAFNVAMIKEYVNYSYYEAQDNGKQPFEGTTHPDVTKVTAGQTPTTGAPYSWLKAPRYNSLTHEVGPLARMVAAHLGAFKPTVSETGSVHLNILNALTVPANYSVNNLVTNTLSAAGTIVNGNPTLLSASNLFSPLGRHAARALECKFVADAMGGDANGAGSWLTQLCLNNPATDGATIATGSGYTYVKIPKNTVLGTGLAEAPRGALGHWVTIQSKKIGSYQCVVPSTWNASPRGTSTTDLGAAESALTGVAGTANYKSTNDAILNIARMLHPYDFCIACAVHLVTPEGKDIAKFDIASDGKITKIPVDSQ